MHSKLIARRIAIAIAIAIATTGLRDMPNYMG
jgi:hypothetical protein